MLRVLRVIFARGLNPEARCGSRKTCAVAMASCRSI